MSADYVRRTYGVPAKRGVRVEHRRLHGSNLPVAKGVIVSFSNHVHVRHDNMSTSTAYHPTDLIYFDKDGTQLWPPEEPSVSNEKIVRVGTAAFIYRDGLLLLGQRLGSHGEGTYSLPGGHVDFGEEPEDAIKREIEEETGMKVLSVSKASPGYVNTHFPEEGKQYITLFFRAECEGEPRVMEPTKCGGWGWYDLDHLPSPLFGALEWLGPLMDEFPDEPPMDEFPDEP